MQIVRGWLELPPGIQMSPAAKAYIRVEDVSRTDAASRMLGHTVVDRITAADVAEGRIAFEVAVATQEPGTTCALRVHLDLGGDGAVSKDDYVSTERIPVLESENEPAAYVRLRRVE